jgi:excisionase family DNA binding protein
VPEESQTLTLEQVANILSCSVRTVRREIDAGRLKSLKFGGRRRVLASDLRSYVEAHRNGTSGETVATDNPTLNRWDQVASSACMVTCGLRYEGDGGIAMYYLSTYSLSHVCEHLADALGICSDEAAREGWMERTDGYSDFSRLSPVRDAGLRHLVTNYPMWSTGGELMNFDCLVEPIRQYDGTVGTVLVVLAPPPATKWRELVGEEFTVDWSRPPEERFEKFFRP